MEKKSPLKSTVAQQKYDSTNCVRVTMKLNRRTDAAILSLLSEVPSMSGYIRSLILSDIEKNHPEHLRADHFSQGDKMAMGHPTPRLGDTLIIPKKK